MSYKDIASVTKEKSAKLLSNAIQIETKNHKKYVFSSFAASEKVYETIRYIWENALLKQVNLSTFFFFCKRGKDVIMLFVYLFFL